MHRFQLQKWISKGGAVHPPRNNKEKHTPIKNRLHTCVRLIHLKRKLLLPLVLILLMCQTPPWTNQNRIDLESKASQVLHQQSIDLNCKNGFQRGVPYRAVHPPRNNKGKTTTVKNKPHNCGRLINLQKTQTTVATCTYTSDVPDSTKDQPKQN